ncbi:hypothetical protein C1645_773925 [Glomus cerebriforme]|uniref:Uncharacterized protein n=1 Tax=Glomus cerebriforme TaxID=658196 RepID=A0A397T198_9GLOM|nr:hypothetical protein C1645_773925 [Glomus cerebriforme]
MLQKIIVPITGLSSQISIHFSLKNNIPHIKFVLKDYILCFSYLNTSYCQEYHHFLPSSKLILPKIQIFCCNSYKLAG